MPQRSPLLILALAYTAFAIYGSLVPLDFRPLPWDQAWTQFQQVPYLNLGIGSRADWVANILLFIPLAFLWLGALWHSNSAIKLLSTTAVLIGAALLTTGIEFTQQFFPPRTVSLNDIIAETLGALIGIGLWWWRGPHIARWLEDFYRQHDGTAERLLWIYLVLLVGYNLLPLDLTISPEELHDKWREGKLILIPFTALPEGLITASYHLATDIVIWIPISLLLCLSGKRSSLHAWAWTVGAAIALEAAQLMVYSRVTDTTDIISGVIGGGLGVLIAQRLGKLPATPTPPSARPLLIATAATLGWIALLCAIFWYPYNFRLDGMFLRPRLDGFSQVPFVSYYYGTEFRAVTSVIHKVSFFVPLGVLLAYLIQPLQHGSLASLSRWAALIVIAGTAFILELGQVALPDKHPGSTDLVLMTLGGALGLWGYQFLGRRLRPGRPAQTPTTLPPTPPKPPSRDLIRVLAPSIVTTACVVLIGSWAVSVLPGIPYNVRELVADGNLLLNGLLLTAFLYTAFGLPVMLAIRYSHSQTQLAWKLPLSLLPAAIAAWGCLFLAVPTESMHDVVGSPVLQWPWHLEIALRFVALLYLLSAAIAIATLVMLARPLRFNLHRLGLMLGSALPGLLILLVIAHLVVVKFAATDNLTELMSGGGSIGASLAASLWLILLASLAAMLAASAAQRRGIGWALLSTLVSAPIAYLLAWFATEQQVVKYEQTFAALQFLLSTDRQHLVSGTELYLRFAVAHAVVIALLAFAQYPLWRGHFAAGFRQLRTRLSRNEHAQAQ